MEQTLNIKEILDWLNQVKVNWPQLEKQLLILGKIPLVLRSVSVELNKQGRLQSEGGQLTRKIEDLKKETQKLQRHVDVEKGKIEEDFEDYKVKAAELLEQEETKTAKEIERLAKGKRALELDITAGVKKLSEVKEQRETEEKRVQDLQKRLAALRSELRG